ncbi:rCG53364, partial [Rattus norvegicus]
MSVYRCDIQISHTPTFLSMNLGNKLSISCCSLYIRKKKKQKQEILLSSQYSTFNLEDWASSMFTTSGQVALPLPQSLESELVTYGCLHYWNNLHQWG